MANSESVHPITRILDTAESVIGQIRTDEDARRAFEVHWKSAVLICELVRHRLGESEWLAKFEFDTAEWFAGMSCRFGYRPPEPHEVMPFLRTFGCGDVPHLYDLWAQFLLTGRGRLPWESSGDLSADWPQLCKLVREMATKAGVTFDAVPRVEPYLGITLGDRSASRTVDGVALGPVEFGSKAKPWELLTMLVEAADDGAHNGVFQDKFGGKQYVHKSTMLTLIRPLRLNVHTDGGIWKLVHLP